MGVSENDVYPHNSQEHDEKSLGICMVFLSIFRQTYQRKNTKKHDMAVASWKAW